MTAIQSMGLSITFQKKVVTSVALALAMLIGWALALALTTLLYTFDDEEPKPKKKAKQQQAPLDAETMDFLAQGAEALASARGFVPPMSGEIGRMQERVNEGKWDLHKLAKERARYLKNEKGKRPLHGLVYIEGVGVVDEEDAVERR